jgi:hypothetical protein
MALSKNEKNALLGGIIALVAIVVVATAYFMNGPTAGTSPQQSQAGTPATTTSQ